jgi:hypothetical protein
VEEELSTYTYDAGIASLGYSLSASPDGIELIVGGYSDKLPVLGVSKNIRPCLFCTCEGIWTWRNTMHFLPVNCIHIVPYSNWPGAADPPLHFLGGGLPPSPQTAHSRVMRGFAFQTSRAAHCRATEGASMTHAHNAEAHTHQSNVLPRGVAHEPREKKPLFAMLNHPW